MKNAADQPKGPSRTSVQLKQIVTPSHIKIYAATPTTDTFEKLAEKPPTSRLAKMGFTAIGLVAAIVALLFPWAPAERESAPQLVDSTKPKPKLPLEDVVPVSASVSNVSQPALNEVLDKLRVPKPESDFVSAPRPAPKPTEIPEDEIVLATPAPAAPLTIKPGEPEPEEVTLDVVRQPQPDPASSLSAPEPITTAAARVDTPTEEVDVMQRVFDGTLAALRGDSDTQELIDFVTRAKKDGLAGAALADAVNAAKTSKTIQIPTRFLSSDGTVDMPAVLKLVEATG